MAKTTGPTQVDILLNETSILAARSQRVLQSILGPPKDGIKAKTEEELEEEDAEIFKPEPDELLGPGFPVPEHDDPLFGMQNGQSLRADEKFRKQMLGKNAKRPVSSVTRNCRTGNTARANVTVPTNSRQATTNRSIESDGERGRSSLGKTKRRKIGQTGVVEVRRSEDEDGERATVPEVTKTLQTPVPEKAKKRSGIYLDEILSERSKKKKKTKKRSGQHKEAKVS